MIKRFFRQKLFFCFFTFIFIVFISSNIFAQKNSQVVEMKKKPPLYYPKIVNQNVTILKIDKSEKQIIVKIKPNESVSNLASLNQKYDVIATTKLFKDILPPEAVLAKLKKESDEIGKDHTAWFWQLDKNSKEYKDYQEKIKTQKEQLLQRIQEQEKLIAKLQERKKKVVGNKEAPDLSNIYLVETKNTPDIKIMVADYSQHPSVIYAEPNFKVTVNAFPDTLPNDYYVDPDQNGSWSNSFGQAYVDLWGVKQVEADKVWKITQGEGIVVAVIDTGVDYNHTEISSNIWTNTREVAGNGIDDDSNGFVDDVRGWDFCNNDNDPIDDDAHGTHCAGTIAAIGNNSMGIIGIAPKVKIMPLKGIGVETGTLEDAADAIVYAVNNGADVLSNSWGAAGHSQLLDDVFANAALQGCVSIVAAGNGDANNIPQDASGYTPANIASVITVAAYGPDLIAADFSNYGNKVDVAAPGVDILSLLSNTYISGNYLTKMKGTSMACPHVAGVVALILSKYKNFSSENIRNVLTQTADVPGVDVPVQPRYIGKGFVNARKALQVTDISDAVVSFKDLTSVISGKFDIKAQIVDSNFASYTLYYGKGANPTQWNQLSSSSTLPALGAVVCSDFDTTVLEEGTYTFKLKEFDTIGLSVEVCASVEIKNTEVYLNSMNNFFRKQESISIKGKLGAQSFKLEYGLGDGLDNSVTSWLTDGITLTNSGSLPITGDVIATLNTSLFPVDQYFCLKLTLSYSNGSKKELIYKNNFIDSALRENFPKNVDSDISGLVVDDIREENSGKELMLVHVKEFGLNGRVFSVFSQEGNLLWFKNQDQSDAFKTGYYGNNFAVPAVADLNNDGSKQIAFNTGIGTGTVCLLDKNGSMLSNWPKGRAISSEESGNSPAIFSSPVFEDIDGDKKLECIVSGLMFDIRYNSSDRFRLLNAWKLNGDYLQGWPNSKVEWASDATASVGDLDKDGKKETIFVEKDGLGLEIIVLDYNGSVKSGWPVKLQNISDQTSSPVLGDIDNDGYLEIILAEGSAAYGKESGKKIHVWKRDGSYASGWPKTFAFNMGHTPALADFNDDKKLEIVVVNSVGDVYVFDYLGNVLSGWPKSLSSDVEEKESGFGIPCYDPVIVDINGDNKFEILTAVYKNYKKYGFLVELHALKFDGTEVSGWPKPMISNNPLSWAGSISVNDIDGDSLLEVVTHMRSNLYIWDINSTYDLQRMPWPQFKHDSLHTGNYDYGKVTIEDPTKPSKPVVSDDGATTKVKTQLFASWVCDDTNNIIADYEYQILEGSVVGNIVRDWTLTNNQKTVTAGPLNLEVGKSYYFAVRAKSNSGVYGDVGYSDGISVVSDTALIAPTGLVYQLNTTVSVDLTWADQSDNEKGFKIERSINNVNFWQIGDVAANVTKFTDSSIAAGSTYYYRVYAYLDDQNSDYSNVVTVKVESLGDVTGPTGTIAVNKNKPYSNWNKVLVEFSAQDSESGMGKGSKMKYTVTNDKTSGNYVKEEEFTAKKIFLLEEGTTSISVIYCDIAGNWSVTPSVGSVTYDIHPPDVKFKINVGAVTTNTNAVILNIIATDSTSGMGVGAKMRFKNESLNWSAMENFSNTKNWVLSDGLGKKTVYVQICDAAGNWSEPVSANINLEQQTAKPVANTQAVNIIKNTVTDITLTAKGAVDTFSIVSDPAHGFLSGAAPNVKYTPVNNYIGQDTFTFKVVKESIESEPALVTINISGVNEPPVFKKISNRNVFVGVKVKFFIKATDADGDKVTYEVYNLPSGATFDKKLGYFDWTPLVEGSYDITFEALDEKLARSLKQTIKITVNK